MWGNTKAPEVGDDSPFRGFDEYYSTKNDRRVNNVGAHPVWMRAFADLDLQQLSVIQSEATTREQSMESRHEHG